MTPTVDGIYYMILTLLAFGFGCYWFLRLMDWWKNR